MRRAAAGVLALAGCFVTGDDSGDRCGGTSCAPGSLVWTMQARSLTHVSVSAVANSPDEPPWFAGNFRHDIQLRSYIFNSPRVDFVDPYVARVDARETPAVWLNIAGGVDVYPRQTAGIFPDGEEGAILITLGEIPGFAWRTAAYRIDRQTNREGVPVQRAVLADMAAIPTSSSAVVTARDGAGWPVVAISGSDLQIAPQVSGKRAVVLRVMQEFRTEMVFDQAGIEITSIAPDTRNTLVIGGHYDGTPPGWPPCPEVQCGFAAIIDAHVDAANPVLRREIFRASLGADVLGVGTDGAGRLAVMGTHEGDAIEPPFVGPNYPSLWLDFGTETEGSSTALSFDPDLDLAGARLVATDRGAVVALSFSGTVQVDTPDGGEVTSDGVGEHDMVITEYPAAFDGTGWRLLVRSDGDTEVTALAVEGTQVAVGGNFLGLMSIASGTILDRAEPDYQGFVLELRR